MRTSASSAPHRVRSTAGSWPVVRVRLLGAVRTLVVLAPRVRCAGFLPVGVPVHRLASLVGRLRKDVLEVAQPLGRELQGSTSVRDSYKARSAVRPIADRGSVPDSGRSDSKSGPVSGNGMRSCSGIAACWCTTTS